MVGWGRSETLLMHYQISKSSFYKLTHKLWVELRNFLASCLNNALFLSFLAPFACLHASWYTLNSCSSYPCWSQQDHHHGRILSMRFCVMHFRYVEKKRARFLFNSTFALGNTKWTKHDNKSTTKPFSAINTQLLWKEDTSLRLGLINTINSAIHRDKATQTSQVRIKQ